MLVGISGILVGGAIAATAGNFPGRKASLERWGGMLLISGIAVFAFAFPHV
jgi:hypothetical protein